MQFNLSHIYMFLNKMMNQSGQIFNCRNLKSVVLILLLFTIPILLSGQSQEESFCLQSKRITQSGMIVLGAWSLGNIATGAIGWSTSIGHKKYFHQMNLFWNTVNLAIAGYALYNNSQTDCSAMVAGDILAKHQQTERILLINSLLDIGYIGTGLAMRYFSSGSPQRAEMLKGYGNSLILQGGFLLIFDGILFGILKNARNSLSETLQFSMSSEYPGFQLVITF